MDAFVVITGYDADLQVKVVRCGGMKGVAQWLIDNMRDSTADEEDLTTYTLAEGIDAALEEFDAVAAEMWNDYVDAGWAAGKRSELAAWLDGTGEGEWDSGEVVAA